MNYKKYFKKVSVIVLLFFLTSTSLIMSYNKGDENKIIKENSNENMEIAITFDDGPHPKETAKILDVLKEKNVKAIFFVTSHYITYSPDTVKRMVAEGHVVVIILITIILCRVLLIQKKFLIAKLLIQKINLKS